MAKHTKKKPKKTVAMKATDVAILRKADPIAKKAKAAFDKSDVSTKRADDLRITGGQLCLEVKAILEGSGIKLDDYLPEHTGRTRAWCADAMTIAAKPDPVAALEKRKAGKAASVRKVRAKAKAGLRSPGGSGPKEGASITEVISTALVKAGENGARNILVSEANRIGHVLLTRDKFDEMAKTPETAGLKSVLAGFNKLTPRDQMLVAEHAAAKVGCTIDKPVFGVGMGNHGRKPAAEAPVVEGPPSDGGEPDMPAFLKRGGKKAKVTTKATKRIKAKKAERTVKRGAVA